MSHSGLTGAEVVFIIALVQGARLSAAFASLNGSK